jgi:hypothetical protein
LLARGVPSGNSGGTAFEADVDVTEETIMGNMIRTARYGAFLGLATCVALMAAAAEAPPAAGNATPLVVAVGEKSSFAPLLPKFVEGYRAKGMTRVERARIANSSHYVMADNPEAVADLIERSARDAR